MKSAKQTFGGSLRRLALSLVAALVMVLGLCPALALAGEVEVEPEPEGNLEPVAVVQGEGVGEGEPTVSVQGDYPLSVGGTKVTDTNKGDIPPTAGQKVGTASYDPESNTLTLTNYSFNDTSNTDKAINYTGTEKDLNIVLVGDNSVKAKEDGVYS